MDGLQGNILNVKLNHILSWTKKRQNIAKLYNNYLGDIPNISLPNIDKDCTHVFIYM